MTDPTNEKVGSTMKFIDYEVLVFFHPSLVCNYSCVYCGQHTNDRGELKEIDIKRTIQRLDELNRTLLVSLSGGEPFLIPNFIEFVQELTKKHYVRMDSNLSLDETCRRFANTINPDKVVEIVFSTHVLEREKREVDLMELVVLVKEFENKGFKMVGNYVSYPPLMERLEKDIDFFSSQGIKVLPTFFCGKFNGKEYPFDQGVLSYSKSDVDLVGRLNPYAKIPLYSPQNEFCQAGCSAFCVNDKHEVFPCLTMMYNKTSKLGYFFGEWKVFPKVIRCPKTFCTDQYNKAFICSLDRFSLSYLQLKALSEKGIGSSLGSSILLNGGWRNFLSQQIRKVFR